MKGFLLLALFSVFLLACTQYSQEQSEVLAEKFILNSPTYLFDGSELELKQSDAIRCSNCYAFTYSFTSSSGGYGDRTDQFTIQVISEHTASVIVKDGNVVQAILDNKWDAINQKELNLGDDVQISYCPKKGQDACPEIFQPVCSSENTEYTNGCEACRVESTTWYVNGGCDSGYVERVLDDLNSGKASKDSVPLLVFFGLELQNQ